MAAISLLSSRAMSFIITGLLDDDKAISRGMFAVQAGLQ